MRVNDLNTDERGFTLLEVLVAFVVLSITLGVIYQMLVSGTLQTAGSGNEAEALLIAQSKIEEAIVEMGMSEGISDGYSWTLETRPITPLSDGDFPAKLINVKVDVKWDGTIGTRMINLETQKLVWDVQ